MKLLVMAIFFTLNLHAEIISIPVEQLSYSEGQHRVGFGRLEPFNIISIDDFDHARLEFKNPKLSSIRMWQSDLKNIYEAMTSKAYVQFDMMVKMVNLRFDNSSLPTHPCYIEKREDITLQSVEYDVQIYGNEAKFYDCATTEEIPLCVVMKDCP